MTTIDPASIPNRFDLADTQSRFLNIGNRAPNYPGMKNQPLQALLTLTKGGARGGFKYYYQLQLNCS